MSKQEFLAQLRKGLSGLPQDDIEERLAFYGEMLDDRIEEGISEEEAVSAIDSVDEIVQQVVAEIPLAKIAKEGIELKRAYYTAQHCGKIKPSDAENERDRKNSEKLCKKKKQKRNSY